MSRAHRSTRTIATAAACIALAASSSAAASPSPPSDGPGKITLEDIAGDANALNDQGEGLIANVRTGHQIDQADLRTVTLAALHGRTRAASRLRISFTTTARPGSLPDGTPLAYGVLLVPGRDCRMTVEYVTARSSSIARSTGPTGVLTHTCDDGVHTRSVLPVRLVGRTATVEVAYRLLPAPARAAKHPGNATAYVRTVPADISAARPVELDSAR